MPKAAFWVLDLSPDLSQVTDHEEGKLLKVYF